LLDARLTAAMTSPVGRRQFMRGQAGTDAQGRYVEPVGGPGSHLIGALSLANCLIVVPEDVTSLDEGDRVQVLMLDSEF
jgi:molybdopterin molybdotransferase